MIESDQPFNSGAIEERYLSIKERVWRAAQRHGREPASVKLVAVTKTFEEATSRRCFAKATVASARTAFRRRCGNGRACANGSLGLSCI